MKGRFGGLWLQNGSGLWSLTNVPVVLNTWTNANDGVGGIDASVVNGKITCKVPGYYVAYAGLSITFPAGEIFTAEFRVNGAASGFSAQVEGIASGGRINLFLMGAADLNENDVVQIYIYSDQAGGSNFVHVDGQFGLMSL